MAKKKKRAATKRIGSALSRFLKKQNPAMKAARAVRVKKMKDGAIKITPVR